MEKKKWYEKWWGLLWTLAVVEASPGRSVKAFMEVDEALKNLLDGHEERPAQNYHYKKKRNRYLPNHQLENCKA